MKAVIYARVSREELDPENQIIALRGFAEKHGIEVVGEFVEQASGYETVPEERKGWVDAVNTAKQNSAAILVVSLDRISRRYRYLVKTLDTLNEHGVQVISIQEPWLEVLATINDQTLRALIYDIIVRVMAYSYQMYVESVREKTKIALIKARAEGKHIGRPPLITDEELEKYLAKYRKLGLNLKSIWKIIRGDGYKISYTRFTVRVKELRERKRARATG